METRSIKKLLWIAITNFNFLFNNAGLCSYFSGLYDDDIINREEYRLLHDYIYCNKPNNYRCSRQLVYYFWKPHRVFPRFFYLIKHYIKNR